MNTAAWAGVVIGLIGLIVAIITYHRAAAVDAKASNAADAKEVADLRKMISDSASSGEVDKLRDALWAVDRRLARLEGRHAQNKKVSL